MASPPSHLPRRPRAQRRSVWKWLFGGVAIVAGVTMVAGGLWVWKLSRDLPDLSGLDEYAPGSITRIYDIHNDLIGEYFSERRVYVPIERIPRSMIRAILAVEDSRFYSHIGIDLVRIGGAVVANFMKGGLRQGGSTVTQQLARTLFLSREKTFTRKLREALLSLMIERRLSKDRILELYLNEIYLGSGAYGVQAAAQVYFGKDIWEISLPEAAFLAGLPKAPTRYTPFNNPKAAKDRQGVVLRRMEVEEAITWEEYQSAYAADLVFQRPKATERQAPYFLEEVRKHLARTYGGDAVYQGGLAVYTTLDAQMQQAAREAVRNGLRALDKRQGWRGIVGHLSEDQVELRKSKAPRARIRTKLIRGPIFEAVVLTVSPKVVRVLVEGQEGDVHRTDMTWARRRLTGPNVMDDVTIDKQFDPVRHLVPGDLIHVGLKKREPLQFALEQIPKVQAALVALDPPTGEIRALVGGYNFGLSQFNRAMAARRQSGSAFKPVVYAAAFEYGDSPATVLMDTPLVFHDPVHNTVWKPENYEHRFFGPTSLREGLVHSRNIASIKLLRRVGIGRVRKFSTQIGVASPLANDLSLALGSSSVGVLEMARAYATFASGGLGGAPYYIRRVTDRHGAVLETGEPTVTRVMSEEGAYLINNVLEDVIRRGTGRKARVLKAHIGGKTGTTNNFTDAWFIGGGPTVTTAVWVGMDDYTTLGDRETGARAALPIWIHFMKTALEAARDEPFPVPQGIIYEMINPVTGTLANPGEEGEIEVFSRRFPPIREAPRGSGMEGFLELDSALPER